MRRFFLLFGFFSSLASGQTRHVPSVDELLTLKSVGAAQISPNGSSVAYIVNETDWKNDNFVSQLWVVRSEGSDARQLTRGEKSAVFPRWSPDGERIAFISSRVDNKPQIFVMRPDGGEPQQLTKNETDVTAFAWSRDGRTIAFLATEPNQSVRDRKNIFADFEVVRREYQFTHIWTIDVASAMKAPLAGTQRTHGSDYSVNQFRWSPDGTRIAFSAQASPDVIQNVTSDIYVLTLAGSGVKKIVDLKGADDNPVWSPDGKQIAFSTFLERRPFFAVNTRIAVVPADGGTPRSLTDRFDENATPGVWTPAGLFFLAAAKTANHMYKLDPQTGRIARMSAPDNAIVIGVTLTDDSKQAALVLASPKSVPEIAVSSIARWSPRTLTSMNSQTDSLTVGQPEVVSWRSKDGTLVEGVLTKPANFDSTKKYPLLVIIHGGPIGVDRPVPLISRRDYPIDTWIGRGAVALYVNYRGGAGYGEKFRTLNMRNPGVGEAWDVISGVDYLIGRGFVDPKRVGCMGWSHGGFISAFVTVTSDRFAAVSVGAGISDWATQYYNTDLPTLPVRYLGGDPVSDPEIYAKASPIAYIKTAHTPTLIQHADGDRRVPIANGYELRQALENRGVPVEMVVYKGFGHSITRPKSQRAVMTHNLVWFNHYLFGDLLPDLRSPLGAPAAMRAGQAQPLTR